LNGPTATQLVLSSIGQQLLSPSPLPKLEARLRELAKGNEGDDTTTREDRESNRIRGEITLITTKIERAEENLALADSEIQFRSELAG
jgi:hypothetical protein